MATCLRRTRTMGPLLSSCPSPSRQTRRLVGDVSLTHLILAYLEGRGLRPTQPSYLEFFFEGHLSFSYLRVLSRSHWADQMKCRCVCPPIGSLCSDFWGRKSSAYCFLVRDDATISVRYSNLWAWHVHDIIAKGIISKDTWLRRDR